MATVELTRQDLCDLKILLDKVRKCALDAPDTLKSLVDVSSLSDKLHQVALLLDETCNDEFNDDTLPDPTGKLAIPSQYTSKGRFAAASDYNYNQ